MQYVSLGKTGLKVSRLGLGCLAFGNNQAWMVELEDARRIVNKALDYGFNFFDTSNTYAEGRSEEIVGEILKDRRDDVIIGTKVCMRTGRGPNEIGLSRYYVMNQIKSSLGRLKTDHVDLYQIHRWDYETPIEETLRTLDDLLRSGKVRYIGASSMHAWQFVKALYTCDKLGMERFVSMQNHYNLLYREEEREMLPLCKAEGIAVLTWGSLAQGVLTGEFQRGQPPETSIRYRSHAWMRDHAFLREQDFGILDRVLEIAKEKGASPAQIALSWLLTKGVTAPVIGATKVQQIEESMGAFDVKLSTDDVKRLEDPYRLQAIVGHV